MDNPYQQINLVLKNVDLAKKRSQAQENILISQYVTKNPQATFEQIEKYLANEPGLNFTLEPDKLDQISLSIQNIIGSENPKIKFILKYLYQNFETQKINILLFREFLSFYPETAVEERIVNSFILNKEDKVAA